MSQIKFNKFIYSTGFACLSDQVTVGNKKDVVDGMISLVRMFRDRSRISKVANSFHTKYSVASE